MELWSKLANMLEGVVIALDAIRSNKVRAGLTILGIAVGVFVVTVMSAAVHGINEGVSRSMAAAGPTTFFITKWPAEITSCTGSRDSCPWRFYPRLTLELAKEIERLPQVRAVTAHISSSSSIKYVDRALPGIQVDGFTARWLDVQGGDIIDGRKALLKLVHPDALAFGGAIFIEDERFARNLQSVFETFWEQAQERF